MNCYVEAPRTSFVFFEDDEVLRKYSCKIYHDGSHYVATLKTSAAPRAGAKSRKSIDDEFDELYLKATVELKLPKREVKGYIHNELYELHPDEPELYEYVESNVKRKQHSEYLKLKRFRRKAFLNEWNYFTTFTYDNDKQSEESFRARLKKCLSNFAVRRGWRAMGVFERAPETGRLHYHCLLYVPQGEMPGVIREVRDYSTKLHKYQTAQQNSFFFDRFGRNDFQPIDTNKFSVRKCIGYITKYLEKTGESIMYSRGIPTELACEVPKDNIANELFDFVQKFALYDDVFEVGEDPADVDEPVSLVNLYNMLC